MNLSFFPLCNAQYSGDVFTVNFYFPSFRPLELLDPKSIVFTVINPQNRYVRFANIEQNNNLRSV